MNKPLWRCHRWHPIHHQFIAVRFSVLVEVVGIDAILGGWPDEEEKTIQGTEPQLGKFCICAAMYPTCREAESARVSARIQSVLKGSNF